ncbi:MAG: NUDIX domain-containing protein [Chloroflexi bacterium]|nr:NUDIX domain-containing protein [Chloroflexota bacterium]
MIEQHMARDGEEHLVRANDQDWIVTWSPPPTAPEGKPHGSAGVCVTSTGEIVLISANGVDWDLPAGRTEGNETWEQTLHREMREEACATVVTARLLGFAHSVCVAGPEVGLALVRSFWRADVHLDAWEPQFEITHRRVMPAAEALGHLPPAFLPIILRALSEAGVL